MSDIQYFKSKKGFAEANEYIPGGVNSPVRSFRGVGGTPVFIESARGAYLYSIDGEKYIDYVCSWGPMIVGHSHPKVIEAVSQSLRQGTSFGAPTLLETELAKLVNKLMPSMKKMRLVNSGTEATMTALRLARGFTKRDMVLKFEGCYHGHADPFLVKAGSGLMTLGQPDSSGVPQSVSNQTLIGEFNNGEQVKELFSKYGEQVAAVIIEPVAGNMNCIPANTEFLKTLRELCDTYASVLIFDEVMSGFRVALGGAQQIYNIKPDLTTIGKIIGGGFPMAALGGRVEIMDELAPLGSVYQAGTLSGNPIAVSAGLATLELIQERDFFRRLTAKTQRLLNGMHSVVSEHGINMQSNQMGGMFGLFFDCHEKVTSLKQVHAGINTYKKIFHGMLQNGVYLAPSAYEAGFMSQAHETQELNDTLRAFNRVVQDMVKND